MQQISLGQSISYTAVGFDQHGNDFPLPPDAQFSWTEDSGGAVIAIDTLDKVSGIAKSMAEGTADVTVGVLVTNPDGSTESFVASDALTVNPATAPVLSAIGIKWGTPTGAAAATPTPQAAAVKRPVFPPRR